MGVTPDQNEIQHIKMLLETVNQQQDMPVVARPTASDVTEEQKRDRVAILAERLYAYFERITAEDFGEVFENTLETINASRTLDTLHEAILTKEQSLIIESAEQFHELLAEMDEDDISAILGRNAYAGDEIDVYSIVQTLGHALDEMNNINGTSLNESATHNENNKMFSQLVNDLIDLSNSWVDESHLNEEKGGMSANKCVEDLLSMLEGKYGIAIERVVEL